VKGKGANQPENVLIIKGKRQRPVLDQQGDDIPHRMMSKCLIDAHDVLE
jgi:hypothetical protein